MQRFATLRVRGRPNAAFFFDIQDIESHSDKEGMELEGINAARIAAVKLSGDLLKDAPDRFWAVGEWKCTVKDDRGLILFVLHFYAQDSAAVAPRTRT